MNECRQFRKRLSQGQFGESLLDLSIQNQRHVDSCPDCREWVSRLAKIEDQLDECQSFEVEPEVLWRMKRNIMTEMDAAPTRTRFLQSVFFSPRLIAFSSATIVLALIVAFRMTPTRQGSDHARQTSYATTTLLLDESDSLDAADPDFLTQALWIQIDSSLIPFIEDEIDAPDSTGLSDSILENAWNFQEDDWNALRRYLS